MTPMTTTPRRLRRLHALSTQADTAWCALRSAERAGGPIGHRELSSAEIEMLPEIDQSFIAEFLRENDEIA